MAFPALTEPQALSAGPLQFRLLRDDEQPRWDAFASAHPYNDFCQAWDWGELKGRGEWRPVRAGVFAGERLVAGAQVLFRGLPGGRALAYACRGPLVDLETPDGAPVRAALFDGLEAVCRERRAIALKMDPCVAQPHTRWLQACGARRTPSSGSHLGGTQPEWVMRLDLAPGLDTVFGGFKADYRNRIRKAPKRGVAVRHADGPDDWRRWYDLLKETAERQQFVVRAYSYFDLIRELLHRDCQGTVLLAEREGRMVGGILCIAYGDTVWYLYGGMNEEGRDHYSGYLLQWEAMQWAAERGCHIYDFRGVAAPDDEDSPVYGLNRFKSGFGPATVQWVGEWDLVFSPLWYAGFTALLPKAKAFLKRRGKQATANTQEA
jgi:lipid II:glycine glycyltransferase (peptidoglycan interpeptide bridge formation enzyme)